MTARLEWRSFEDPRFHYDGSIPHSESPTISGAFNTNAIVYDNTPWRPGRDIDMEHRPNDERKIKNLATRIMSNGVEVLVRDKNSDGKQEQRNLKVINLAPSKTMIYHATSAPPNKSLITSAVATVVNRQHMSAFIPLHQMIQHNYIIKTCMTTYTYLTTVVQNKRSAVSTFETIVSVVTTESLTNLYATDVLADLKPTKTKYMEVKTIQPSAASNVFPNSIPKIDKRIDSEEEHNFDLIQPSEISHVPCTTTSCSCSHTETEMLKTKYSNLKQSSTGSSDRYALKTSKYSGTKVNPRPTHKDTIKQTFYHPYEYETSSQSAPTDKIVEKYTQVNDYSDENTNSIENSDLLTNEQAPPHLKNTKVPINKTTETVKPEKPPKVNKNKFVMAELIKLGSLGIKSLSQLAPVIEKMTGGFMKRQETNKTATTTTTTFKPARKVTSYSANKRIDNDLESKVGNFPIYIPVDEMETSESQMALTNVTLHQNFAWAAEHSNPIAHLVKPKIIHESPLLNGGIPISPGEIITANSDVIVGKPAVGGPLSLVSNGIKLQNHAHPLGDSVVSNNEIYIAKEKPPYNVMQNVKVDDSFDLRPPELPKLKSQLNSNLLRPQGNYFDKQIVNKPPHLSATANIMNERIKQSGVINTHSPPILVNHGRPAFLDYIPHLDKTSNKNPTEFKADYEIHKGFEDQDIPDNNPSSSEIVSKKILSNGEYANFDNSDSMNSPFLVDIQPSRVANVLIPHGSSTALVFAGSSEPHKTGDYVDDPLPYPEPGYFGSFSIDAPQMTNVHNVIPNKSQFIVSPTKDTFNINQKSQWNDNKRPKDLVNLPLPTSNQEKHVRVGPQITVYNPDLYSDFERHIRDKKIINKPKEGMEVIDKEYENYLAVPPPPPKLHSNPDVRYEKNKHHLRPTVHTKPTQDSNIFLNIQHPVTNQLPPKVTSEIYFASQMPSNQATPTYTIKIPPPSILESVHSNLPRKPDNQLHKTSDSVSSNTKSKPLRPNLDNGENAYSVTLNTATNIASDSSTGHIIGSSITVPITTTSLNGQINANIPIGTNIAIRVQDDPDKYESVALHGKIPSSLNYHVNDHPTVESFNNYEVNSSNITKYTKTNEQKDIYQNNTKAKQVFDNFRENFSQSFNSHANFPIMISENTNTTIASKPTYVNSYPKEEKIPSLFLPNVSTNSHGWYASVLNEENFKNIKVEGTNRKVIPLNYDPNNDNLPAFGEKIATVGKPPTTFWDQKNKHTVNNFSIGQPFSKQNDEHRLNISSYSIRPNYIPSIYNNKQQVYDIPLRDNSYETTSFKSTYSRPVKTVYETPDDVYDGEEGSESSIEIDGEVSSESMKVPIITPSTQKEEVPKYYSSISQNKTSSNVREENKDVLLLSFNPGTQTEKPFISKNRTSFQTNSIKSIYNRNPSMKPRPFTINSPIPLDHQLQQPHWQINQLMENVTNVSYEDNMELNVGEKIYTSTTSHPITVSTVKTSQKPFNSILLNNTRVVNESNIITSIVHIQDKKPLIVEINDNPTLTVNGEPRVNISSSEIINLSPPPNSGDHTFKLINQEIMGMSPPPQRTPSPRYPARPPQTPRPIFPIRTSPPYRTLPPRTLPPKQSTQRPLRKPINRDEISTYRPTYDIINKIKRPVLNMDQPSSHLLPPPRELPSISTSIENFSKSKSSLSSTASVVFPTTLSSSWLTSSNFEFSSNLNFGPTSIYFPNDDLSTKTPTGTGEISSENSSENVFSSNEYDISSEIINVSYENPITQKILSTSKHGNITKPIEQVPNISPAGEPNFNKNGFITSNSSQEEINKDKVKLIPIGNKTRSRKPYPVRIDDKKTSTYRFKPPSKIIPVIKPTRTLSRPEIPYQTKVTSVNKVVRPLPYKPLPFIPTNIIEGSESSIDDDYITATEVLKENAASTPSLQLPSIIEKTITSTLIISKDVSDLNIHKTHHAGNEIKILDEILPTKTEFKTTIITLTKTLSEPPQTVSSIGYVNLTHTLTVTHTETSLVSQSEGAVTETLFLTNIHTSTLVDVVTEVYTHVQPTTIVETVTKHIPIPQVEATPVLSTTPSLSKIALDDITMSSEENEIFIINDSDNDATENIQKIDADAEERDSDTFFVVMNKSQNGGKSPPISTDIETGDYDGVTRNEQVNSNGVSQVLFGEILLAGTPYSETTNVGHPTGAGYGKECQPDCKASRNERCQRIDGLMKCVCRPGFARMFPDRPCKPTYTYSVRLALGSRGKDRLQFHTNLSDNSSKDYHNLAIATHEGINRMVMQSDLRDVYHGVHITGFYPIDIRPSHGDTYQGVINDFYVQLSDNAHESRLKEVIEKYLRNNNYSLGGTEVHAAEELMDRLNVSDFDECTSTQFHDCSEHARCFNLRGTYTCSCLEGFADLSVNTLYPGRICSSDAVGCAGCNYHGTCFERESAMICECFKWYAGRTCQVNLKAVLITVTVIGAVIILVVTIWASKRCCSPRSPATQTFVIGCMPNLHQGTMPSKQRADRRALIAERMDTAETCSVQNTSLPYIPSKSRSRSTCSKKISAISDPPSHAPPPPPAPALMIPRARLHPIHSDSRDNLSRKKSSEICNEAKLISYLESGVTNPAEEMRRKHSMESSYSINKERPNKQGALVSAGFKVSTTVRPDDSVKEDRDDTSSIHKTDLDDISRFDTLRKSYSQEDMSEWTDAERRIGELTLSEARSVGGTLPASTGRAASSTRLTHQEANTMAERDLGSTFLLPHVHLYKPDLTSDVSEFDSL